MIVAGTFDVLHDGHAALLHTAFAHGEHVEIWITDDAMGEAKAKKTGQALAPYVARRDAVAAWCDAQTGDSLTAFIREKCPALGDVVAAGERRRGRGGLGGREGPGGPGHTTLPAATTAGDARAHLYRSRHSAHELHDAFGPSITDAAYTAITCSEETLPGCALINAKRAAAGLAPLEVIVAPLVMDGSLGRKVSSTDIRAARQKGGGGGGGGAGGASTPAL
jgi:cytidyltransferase-like protein